MYALGHRDVPVLLGVNQVVVNIVLLIFKDEATRPMKIFPLTVYKLSKGFSVR